MKNRAICLIDGLNLYHSLEDSRGNQGFPFKKYKWLDLNRLVKNFIRPLDELRETYYFTTICNWDPTKASRQNKFIHALKNTGVKVRKGNFKNATRKCLAECRKEYPTHEEKRTDVLIATTLISLAYEDVFDNAYILSADTDQIPAIELVMSKFQKKKVYVILPIDSKADELTNVCAQVMRIKEHHLESSVFDKVLVSNATGKEITCPPEWDY